jgi:hypothetical protein
MQNAYRLRLAARLTKTWERKLGSEVDETKKTYVLDDVGL